MKRKYKAYVKLNLLSLFFIAVSFISITLAWFAYSGISTVSTEVDIKAWNIEFMQDTKVVSNQIVINLDDVYPGMETTLEEIVIHNLGDSDAVLNYEVQSARFFNENVDVENQNLDDVLSHSFPFHVNIALKDRYVKAKDGESKFSVSISWPLDSLRDDLDSLWGNRAYTFEQEELAKKSEDPNYVPKKTIQIVISLKAEQYIESDEAPDLRYNFGDMLLYDVVLNKPCDTISDTCLRMFVIDRDNKKKDETVTLVPDILRTYPTGEYGNYESLLNEATSNWSVQTRSLTIEDMLSVISFDVYKSYLKRDTLSDVIIGKVYLTERMNEMIAKSKDYNGYFIYNSDKFPYLASNKCYWVNSDYSADKAFAFVKDAETAKLFGEIKTNSCSVLPVVTLDKMDLDSSTVV